LDAFCIFLLFFTCYFSNRCDLVVIFQRNETNTLCRSTHHAECIYPDADYNACFVNNHQVILIGNTLDGDKLTRFVRDVDGLHTFTTSVSNAVIIDIRAFSVAFFRNNQYRYFRTINTNHANNLVLRSGECDSSYARGSSAHRTNGRFVEANGTSGTQCHDNFTIATSQTSLDQLISFSNIDGVNTICTWS